MPGRLTAILLLILGTACSRQPPEVVQTDFQAVSLLGDTLTTPTLDPEIRNEFEARLAQARASFERAPDDVDSIIWYGRRTAYLGRYREAIDIFTTGIAHHPEDPRLYRHRGHRYITTRQFDRAIADFERAAILFADQPDEMEPDGLPNEAGIPTSTLQGNVWYHLGLAHFLLHDWTAAAEAYRRGMELDMTTDMRVAFANWYYLTLMRTGLPETAAAMVEPFDAGTEIIENTAYLRLISLYRGMLPVDSLLRADADALASATTLFGVGNWYLSRGDTTLALETFETILESPTWAAFGFIGAEAELVGMER